jgi:hypothetical protein
MHCFFLTTVKISTDSQQGILFLSCIQHKPKEIFQRKNHKISQNTYKIGDYKDNKHLPI